MKRIYFRSFMFLVLGSLIISCSKEDATVTEKLEVSATKAVTYPHVVNFPAGFPKPGIEPAPSITYPYSEHEYDLEKPQFPFTRIDNPTQKYIKETCHFDISHLENNHSYHQINNKKINIAFFFSEEANASATKINVDQTSQFGWNLPWGASPFVEEETPQVLHVFANLFVMVLSKPVTEFGFEMAVGNQNREHDYAVYYGDYNLDPSSGIISNTLITPGGARLFAIKSTKPFTVITIHYQRRSSADIPFEADNVALANIRYKLAK